MQNGQSGLMVIIRVALAQSTFSLKKAQFGAGLAE
jgi:hypothetical protein